MKVLVLGNDGRAHALVWKLFNNPLADVICAPGNGGTSQLAPQLDLEPSSVVDVARWAFDQHINLIVPASSEPLRAGLVDEVVAMQIGVCGPSQRSTLLEQSRCYAKDFLKRYSLPTPPGRAFDNAQTAEKYLAAHPLPVVIKGDHPHAGDGIFDDRYAAIQALHESFAYRPLDGENNGVVIEEFVPGIRVSFSALTDGTTALPMLPTRIYNHRYEHDQGPTATGMGAHTGASTYAQKLTGYLHQRLMLPIVHAMAQEKLPYWGILGIDCVITDQGPSITAFRCSFHDMEAQVVLPRLEDDLLPLIQAAIARRLDQVPPLRWRDQASVGIALVTEGYPHHYAVGQAVEGLTDLEPGVLVFHDQTSDPRGLQYTPTTNTASSLAALLSGAGTDKRTITTTGGHALTVVATAATLAGARGRALLNAERITYAGRRYRSDIGEHEFR